MNLIHYPKVYLIGQQQFDDEAWANFIKFELDKSPNDFFSDDKCSDSELLCETAGRICYMSFGRGRKTNQEYLANIIQQAHGSVAEHAVYNFVFTGVSRSLTHELVRHRSGWSYSQLSQRFVDETEANYVIPVELQEEINCSQHRELTRLTLSPKSVTELYPWASQLALKDPDLYDLMATAGDLWRSAMAHCQEKYIQLTGYLENKISKKYPEITKTDRIKAARGTARSVLPNATETKIFCTANARALRHTIELRCSRGAEVEIRRLFNEVYTILKDVSPNLFGDYETSNLPDGTVEITTSNKKI